MTVVAVEIVWDEIWDAFLNTDDDLLFFLDLGTGEVFAVPADYADEDFWEEVEDTTGHYLPIPPYDYEQERNLLSGFIKTVANESLRLLLERNFSGRSTYGRLDDILAFYPDEQEQWAAYRENQLTSRIKSWLEEHDIYATDYSH
jgi:hypothetical protein